MPKCVVLFELAAPEGWLGDRLAPSVDISVGGLLYFFLTAFEVFFQCLPTACA